MRKSRHWTAKRKKRHRNEIRKIAARDIRDLFQMASVEANGVLTRQYIAEAREISKRTRTPIPRKFRHSFCRFCGASWFRSQRRVRIRSSGKSRRPHIVFTCFNCRHMCRIPLNRRIDHHLVGLQRSPDAGRTQRT